MQETVVEVGRFSLDTKTEVLTGPRDYFEARGGVDAAVQSALRSAVFEIGAAGESPSPQVALLVALQTDYAAFAGARDFARMRTAYGEQLVGLWTAPFTNFEIVAIPVCASCGIQMRDGELDSSLCASCEPEPAAAGGRA